MPFWWDEKRVYNLVQQMCMRKGCFLLFFCLTALVVGLERTFYTVSESVEAVEICITAVAVNTPCPALSLLKSPFQPLMKVQV